MSNKKIQGGKIPRTFRISSQIQRILADALFELAQKGVIENMITITGVEVSGDLRIAKVYFSSLTPEDIEILNANRVKLQHQISMNMHVKSTPILSFYVDPTIQAANRIDEIINRVSEQTREPHVESLDREDVESDR